MNHVPSPRKLSSWFPLGPYLRIFLIIFSVLGITTDILVVGPLGSRPFQPLIFLIPHLPFIGLGLGIRAGVWLWFTSIICAIFLYSDNPSSWFVLVPASIVVPLYVAFLQPKKKSIIFAILSLAILVYSILAGGVSSPHPEILVIFFTVISFGLGLVLHRYRFNLSKSKQQILDLQVAQRRARKEERTRLAHELHDIVAHEVTVIAMQARRAQFAKDPQQTERILTSIGDSASQALDDLRKLVSVLKADDAEEPNEQNELTPTSSSSSPQLLNENDLSGETTTAIALTHDLHKIAEALENAGFNVALNITGNVSVIPATWRQILRRTTREIGTNILKHASHREPVQIALSVSKNKVTLASANTISAEEPISSTRTGLESITARFDALGGTTTFNEAGGIWSIQVVLPLSP